jgi:hypothetical protein
MKKLLRIPVLLVVLAVSTLLAGCGASAPAVMVGGPPRPYYTSYYYAAPRPYYRPARVVVRPAPVVGRPGPHHYHARPYRGHIRY